MEIEKSVSKAFIFAVLFIVYLLAACTPARYTISNSTAPIESTSATLDGATAAPPQPTIIPTQKVAVTATKQATSTSSSEVLPEEMLKDRDVYPTLALLFSTPNETRELYFYTPEGKLIRKIGFDEYPWAVMDIQEVNEACTLLLEVRTGEDIRLIRYDVKSGNTQEIFKNQGRVNDTWKTWPKSSLDQKYLSYVVWSGGFFYDSAAFQDVEVISTQSGRKPIRLTRHGGAWKSGGEWSPVGNQIAYSDYDENGYQQLMVTNMEDQKKYVLTDFKDQKIRIGQIAWSPSGNRINFVVIYNYRIKDGGQTAELWSINLKDRALTQFVLPPDIYSIFPISWSVDGRKAIIAFGYNKGGSGLAWLDMDQQKARQSLDMTDQASSTLYNLTFPFSVSLDNDIIGFESTGDIYFLDPSTRKPVKVDGMDIPAAGTLIKVNSLAKSMAQCE